MIYIVLGFLLLFLSFKVINRYLTYDKNLYKFLTICTFLLLIISSMYLKELKEEIVKDDYSFEINEMVEKF